MSWIPLWVDEEDNSSVLRNATSVTYHNARPWYLPQSVCKAGVPLRIAFHLDSTTSWAQAFDFGRVMLEHDTYWIHDTLFRCAERNDKATSCEIIRPLSGVWSSQNDLTKVMSLESLTNLLMDHIKRYPYKHHVRMGQSEQKKMIDGIKWVMDDEVDTIAPCAACGGALYL